MLTLLAEQKAQQGPGSHKIKLAARISRLATVFRRIRAQRCSSVMRGRQTQGLSRIRALGMGTGK